jgi:hypothetical protein
MASVGEYCRTQAAVCARLAEGAVTDPAKAELLNLQQRWLEEAAEADAEARSVQFWQGPPPRGSINSAAGPAR